MSAPQSAINQKLRLTVPDFKKRFLSGELVTVLDSRGDQAWESSPIKIRGASRVVSAELYIDPSWPKDRLTVVY